MDNRIINRTKETANSSRCYWIAVLVISIIGLALRLYFGFCTQLTDDELSAIARTRFDNFHDLITQGVMIEGHPAGVQVFMWIWRLLFGTSEWVVRAPFILMGAACIPIIYKVGSLWNNRNAGLFAAVAMALSHYTILYSYLARPYSAGMFFSVCMLYFWSKLFALSTPPKRPWLCSIGLAVCFAACAYIHQFAMLTATLTAAAGLWFVTRDNRKYYLFALILAVVLWLPHLPITWYQFFCLKGLSWLGKPSADFIIDYVAFFLNFSWWLVAAVVLMLYCCCRSAKKQLKQGIKVPLIILLLWLLPIVIGFCYSVLVSSVLQYSCLIFSWPYIILLVSLFFKEQLPTFAIASFVLWAIVLGITSFECDADRKDQVFETTYLTTLQQQQAHGNEQVMCCSQIDTLKTNYYVQKYCRPFNTVALTGAMLDSMLSCTDCPYLVTSETDHYDLAIIRHHYPIVHSRRDLKRSSVYVLSRSGTSLVPSDVEWHSRVDLDTYNVEDEYINILDTSVSALCDNRFKIIDAAVRYHVDSTCQEGVPMIVLETLLFNHCVDYHAVGLDNMPWGNEGRIIIELYEIIKSNYFLPFFRLKVYIWNPTHSHRFQLTESTITIRQGNKNRFSLTERHK